MKLEPPEIVSPFLPFISEKYSLEYDMLFGWVPDIEHGSPIPLRFKDSTIDDMVSSFWKLDSSNPQAIVHEFGGISAKKGDLLYLGHRPMDSFMVHETLCSNETYCLKFSALLFSKYGHIRQFFNDKNEIQRPFIGMNPKLLKNLDEKSNNLLIFDSNFESGNLDAVIKLNENEYYCYIRVDSNTKGHTNWFYFKIMNTTAKQKIKINIANFVKFQSLYDRVSFDSYLFIIILYN